MGGFNSTLSLLIESKTSGSAELDKLSNAFERLAKVGEQTASKLEESGKKTEKVEEQIKKLGETVKSGVEQPFSTAGDVLKGFADKLGPVGIAAGATVGVIAAMGTAAFEAMHKLGELGTQVNNVSIRTGLSTKEVGQFGFAAKAAGSDIGALETGMRMLSKGLADGSEDGKKAREQLKAMGIDARDSLGNIRPMSAVLTDIGSGLERMTGTANRNVAALNIFGRSGLELIPTLVSLRENLDVAKEHGFGLSEDEVRRFERYHQEVAVISEEFARLGRAIAKPFVATLYFLLKSGDGKPLSVTDLQKMGISLGQYGTQSSQQTFAGARAAGLNVGGLESEQRGYDLARIGDFANQAAAAKAAQEQIDRDKGIYGRTREGAQKNLSEAETKERKAFETYTGSQGASVEGKTPAELRKIWQDATVEVAKYKAQVDALKESVKDLNAVPDFVKRILGGELNPVEKKFAERDQFLREHKYLSSAQRQSAQDATLLAVGGEGGVLAEMRSKDEKATADRANFYSKETAKGWDEAYASLHRYDQEVIKSFNQQAATARELRNVNVSSERQGIERQSGRALRLAELGAGSGTEEQIGAANSAYQIRLALAKELRSIDIDTAHQELDVNKQRVDLAKAEAEYRKQTQDAALENELRLVELQKQRVDQFRSLAVDFVSAAESHSLPSFFKQQGQKIQSQVVGNLAESFFTSKAGQSIVGNLSLTNDPNSFVGKLLAGTPFGAKAADPGIKAAQDTALNTKLTVEILAVIASGLGIGGVSGISGLSTSGISIPGFGGSGGLNIPGLSTFGSDTNGITGRGPLGVGGLLGTLGGLFGGGAPSVTADELSNLGVFKPADGSTASSASRAASAAHGINLSDLGANLSGANGIGSQVGAGATVAAAAFGAAQGVLQATKGGARNIIGGIGETAASVAAFTGPAAPFVLAGGMALSLISSLFGDPKQIRQRDIGRRLAADQFYTPTALDVTAGVGGLALGTDRFGNLQTLDASPYPQVQQPYADLRNGITVPGRTVSPIGGPSGINSGPAMNVTINTFDSQSFAQYAHSNRGSIADAVGAAVLSGHGEGFVQAVAPRMQ